MFQASCARLNSRSAAVIATFARSLSWLLLRICAPDLDGLLVEGGIDAREAGAFPFVFIGQCGALDDAQDVAGLHGVAGAHLIDDGARRLGEQGGAHGRDDQAGGGDIAHEGAALHDGGAHAAARNDLFR